MVEADLRIPAVVIGGALVKRSKLVAALRRVWMYCGVRTQALGRARTGPGRYVCALCRSVQPPGNVQVDHKEGLAGLDWNGYIEALFCAAEGLQVLCRPCHSKKTAAQRAARKKS